MQISLFSMLVWEIVVSEVEVNAQFLTLHLSHHMMMDCKHILKVRVCVLIEYTRTHKLFIVLYVSVCVRVFIVFIVSIVDFVYIVVYDILLKHVPAIMNATLCCCCFVLQID